MGYYGWHLRVEKSWRRVTINQNRGHTLIVMWALKTIRNYWQERSLSITSSKNIGSQKSFGPINILVPKKFGQKELLVQKKFWSKKNFGQMAANCNNSSCAKNLGWKDFLYNVLWLSKKCSRPIVFIKVANGSIVEHIGNGDRLQCQRLCQNLGVEGLSKKCPMTFPTMFQASSVYKSCKWKHSATYGNYSGPGRLGSVNMWL